MKKVAIVGVEGSGKTVMLACLGELYTTPDEHGYFLRPENFETQAYVTDKITRMRKGEWPMATAEDAMQGLNWTLCRRRPGGGRPDKVCQISFLDFAGEVYRAAFGIRKGEDESLSDEIDQLNEYISEADDLIVLINLRDVIDKGVSDKRVQESVWITSSILDTVFNRPDSKGPRASIAITQADSYADTIRTYGGARGVLAKYLPHVSNSYDWLDIYDVTAVDETVLDDDGNSVPAPDFKPVGLQVLMNWITNLHEKDSAKKKVHDGEENAAEKVLRPKVAKTIKKPIVQTKQKPSRKIVVPKTGNSYKSGNEDIDGDDNVPRVNIVLYVFSVICAGMWALKCFATGHWVVGVILGGVCFNTIGMRGDKEHHQTAGKWLGYLILLFISGVLGSEGHWISFFVLMSAGYGLLQRK